MHQSLLLLVLTSLCPFTMSQNYMYHFINESKNWTAAQQYCRDHYTDLVTVSNVAEMRNICPNRNKEAWIGLYNKNFEASNKQWHWSQPGQSYTETEANWDFSQRNDIGGKENCLSIKKYTDGKLYWIDDSCCARHAFICYDENSQSKYTWCYNDKTWLEALQYCRQYHTDLVSGHDQLNDDNFIRKIQAEFISVWIGLFRETWGWSDGSGSSFRNWAEKEMILCESQTENKCAKLREDDKWESTDCTEEHPFICYDDRMVLVKQNKTWEEALLFCRKHWGDLAVMTNKHQQRMVQERAKMADTEIVWVGLYFVCFFEEWVWVNGQWVSSSHPNWDSYRQNDCSASGAMQRGGEHKWVKRPSGERHNFVCTKHCQVRCNA